MAAAISKQSKKPWFKRPFAWITAVFVFVFLGPLETCLGWLERLIAWRYGTQREEWEKAVADLKEWWGAQPVIGSDIVQVVSTVGGFLFFGMILALWLGEKWRPQIRDANTEADSGKGPSSILIPMRDSARVLTSIDDAREWLTGFRAACVGALGEREYARFQSEIGEPTPRKAAEYGRRAATYIDGLLNRVESGQAMEDAQEAHHQLEQRGWLSPSHVAVHPIEVSEEEAMTQWVPSDGSQPSEAQSMGRAGICRWGVVAKNTGKTPCYINQQIAEVIVHDSESIDRELRKILSIPPKAVKPRVPVPPGQSVKFDANLVLRPVGTIVEEVESGEKLAVIAAKFVYDDIFGKSHLTQFCYRVIPSLRNGKVMSKYSRMD